MAILDEIFGERIRTPRGGHIDVMLDTVEEIVNNVFCPTGPGGGVNPTCSPQGTGPKHPPKSLPAIPSKSNSPQAATHLHTAEGVVGHVLARKHDNPANTYTDLEITKLKAMNPNGIKDGVFYTVHTGGGKDATAKKAAQVEHLKKILPAGTIIKAKYISGSEAESVVAKMQGKTIGAQPSKVDIPASTPSAPIQTAPAATTTTPTPTPTPTPTTPSAGPKKLDQYDWPKVPKLGDAAKVHPVIPLASANVPHPSTVTVLQTLPGSTAPKLVQDTNGQKWVMKQGEHKQPQLKNEADADAVYRSLGIHTPLGGLHTDATTGQVTKFTQFIEGAKTLGEWEKTATPSQRKALNQQLGKNFALDALLANWDVVGLSKDNILVDANGIAHRADNGGALLYRAQGSPKGSKFGPEVTELESMRSKSINPSTASVYGHLKDSDIRKQMEHLIENEDKIFAAISDYDTRNIIGQRLNYYKKKLEEGFGVEKPKEPHKTQYTPGTAPGQTTDYHGHTFDRPDIPKPTLGKIQKDLVTVTSNSTVSLPTTHDYVNKADNEAWAVGLSQSQEKAVGSWKKDSGGVRQRIRNAVESGDLGSDKVAKSLISAIEAHKPQPGVYYRGIHKNLSEPEFLTNLIENAKKSLQSGELYILDPLPHGLSASPSVSASFSQGDVVVRMVSKSARPLFNVKNYDHEAELVAPPMTQYRVKAIHENVTVKEGKYADKYGGALIKHFIDLEEV
jgi:hypothetical protein